MNARAASSESKRRALAMSWVMGMAGSSDLVVRLAMSLAPTGSLVRILRVESLEGAARRAEALASRTGRLMGPAIGGRLRGEFTVRFGDLERVPVYEHLGPAARPAELV